MKNSTLLLIPHNHRPFMRLVPYIHTVSGVISIEEYLELRYRSWEKGVAFHDHDSEKWV